MSGERRDSGHSPAIKHLGHSWVRHQAGRVILWLLGALAGLAAIVGYWYLDTRGYLDRIAIPGFVKDKLPQAGDTTRPVYRWRDDQGRVQITDQPPAGRPYEEVIYRQDANVIPSAPDKNR
jgi:hypothetical protein